MDLLHSCRRWLRVHIKVPRLKRGGALHLFTDCGGQEFQVEDGAGWVCCAEEGVFPLPPLLFLDAFFIRSSVGVRGSQCLSQLQF